MPSICPGKRPGNSCSGCPVVKVVRYSKADRGILGDGSRLDSRVSAAANVLPERPVLETGKHGSEIAI
jgi:hypothetical protein